jgi:hypothetical protein
VVVYEDDDEQAVQEYVARRERMGAELVVAVRSLAARPKGAQSRGGDGDELLGRQCASLPGACDRQARGLGVIREVQHCGERGVLLKQMVRPDDPVRLVWTMRLAAQVHPVTRFSRDEKHRPTAIKHMRANERSRFPLHLAPRREVCPSPIPASS